MISKKSIQTQSGEIRLTEAGQGEPLLMVHGLFATSSTFDLFFERLPEKIRAVAMDLPGSGESAPGPGFRPTWQSYSEAVIQTMDAIGEDRLDLLGHSMGGGIAALTAAAAPERIRRLILVDAVSLPYSVPIKGRLPLIPMIGDLLFRLYGEGMFIDYFKHDVFLDPQKADLDKIKALYRFFAGDRSFALDALRATADPAPVEAVVGKITCPTLVLWGEKDGLVPLGVGERLASSIKNAKLSVIGECGHTPLEECPEPAVEEIRKFLA